MAKFLVSRSQWIEAPKEKVFELLNDLTTWPKWSPWVIADPETRIEYSTSGKSYSWESHIVGAGCLEIISTVENQQMECALHFLKPWKSDSLTRFVLAEKNGGTEVQWVLHGSLPFWVFWMKGMMEVWVGGDYERGLLMLKDYIEGGDTGFRLSFAGEQPIKGFPFAGLRAHSKIADIAPSMKHSCDLACTSLQNANIEATGPMFCQIEKWDMRRGECEYVVGLPLAQMPATLPTGMEPGEMPDCRVYAIEHHGRYRHLGNAWSAGMMRAHKKIFAQNKSIKPFEIYEKLPENGDESVAVTRVCFPVK